MATTVRGGLIQTSNVIPPTADTSKMSEADIKRELEKIKEAMIQKNIALTEQAAKKGVQVLCYQELFNGPYFCAEHHKRWYDFAEPVPGPTVERMREVAKKLSMVLIVPVYERAITGVYYNTAAVIDADGKFLGIYRKNHIPYVHPGFYEKFYFKPGNVGYPVFQTAVGTIGVYICYDRHFPEGARILGLHGAWIIFNPSATIAGVSKYIWELEQPAHAVANGYYVGAINRVGTESPWNWATSMDRATSATREGKSSPRGARIRMRSSWRILIWIW